MAWHTTACAVFALCSALIVYVYLGYPLIVFLIGKLRGKAIDKGSVEPEVSLIISAFNEEKAIRGKIENTLELEYPADKLEIIVVSDGSTDSTDNIVSEFADRGVRLVRQERGGKTAAQNLAVEHSGGDIILFSDATSMYRPDVVRKMVANFADKTVGCVAGKLIYVDPTKSDTGSGSRSYWGYETFLKENESLACSLIGVSGCLYAVRARNYIPMYPEACSDFLIATLIFGQGLKTVYEPEAVCIEETNVRSDKEMRMRIRVIAQTFSDLWRNRRMLNPFVSGFFAIQLISHKLLRYCIPLFLIGVLLSSAILATDSTLFLLIFGVQIAFYLAAIAAWVLGAVGIRLGLFSIPYYFVLTNVASVAGFLQFLRGKRYAAWEPIRETGQY